MLILSRRPNESLRIGDNITITVVSLNGNQIRLGITAPPHVAVDREEIHQRKLAERVVTVTVRNDGTAQSTETRTARRKLVIRARPQSPGE